MGKYFRSRRIKIDVEIPAPNAERIGDELDSKKAREGFINGAINGLVLRVVWDKEMREKNKDLGYLLGNVAIGLLFPPAYIGVIVDAVNGNYKELKSYFD